MQGVLLAFLQSRAKEALAAGQRLAECGSPQSALEIQLDFAREALQAYADQFHTLGRITSAALDDCSRPLKRAAPGAARPAGRASPPEPDPAAGQRGRDGDPPCTAVCPRPPGSSTRSPFDGEIDRIHQSSDASGKRGRGGSAPPGRPRRTTRRSVAPSAAAPAPPVRRQRKRAPDKAAKSAQPTVQQPAVTPTTRSGASVRSRRERAGFVLRCDAGTGRRRSAGAGRGRRCRADGGG